MRQPSKMIGAVRDARRPSFSSAAADREARRVGRHHEGREAALAGRRRSVRATTTYQRAKPALVIQAFSPSSTQSSPSRRAVVRMRGGVAARAGLGQAEAAERLAAAELGGSTLRLSSSLPKWTIGQQQTELETLMVTPRSTGRRGRSPRSPGSR